MLRHRSLTCSMISIVGFVAVVLAVIVPRSARGADEAANYPARPIRIVIPFQTGGLPDIAARIIGPKLVDVWKRPVIIDNRPGAGSIIGTEIIAKSNPDGYSLLMTSAGHATFPALYSQLPFDCQKDFAGVILAMIGGYALVVPPSLGMKSLKDLIAVAAAKPGQLNFASAGIGTGTYFAGELFKDLAKVNIVHVAYRGIPDALTDTIAGRVQMFVLPLASVAPLVKDGRLLALAGSRKVAGYENIPTFEEQGVKGYEWSTWAGLLAPAKTPRAIINKLNRQIKQIVELPDIQQRITVLGAEPAASTPAELDKLVADQVIVSTGLARRAGLKPQ
jgi:tripartite-type tricarboxylate transporter receptor subunit TctC